MRRVGSALFVIAMLGGMASSEVARAETACSGTGNGTPTKPFPQAASFPACSNCIKPSGTGRSQSDMNDAVKDFYDLWKANYLKQWTTGTLSGKCYVKGEAAGVHAYTPVGTSEGHGFGMLILVFMAGSNGEANAKALFDKLNDTRKALPSIQDGKLMNWLVPASGNPPAAVDRQDSAVDGDMDMAMALLLAHKQWGVAAYKTEALEIIAAMKARYTYQVSGTYLPRFRIGAGGTGNSAAPESLPYLSRPSDYMIGHLEEFYRATNDTFWTDMQAKSISILLHVRNGTTGLVPDFLAGQTPQPSTTGPGDEDVIYDAYDYNAARVPLRMAWATAYYKGQETSGAYAIANKMADWVRGSSITNNGADVEGFKAGYELDGTVLTSPSYRSTPYVDITFTAPMVTAGIVNSAHQSWLNAGWDFLVDFLTPGSGWPGQSYLDYYNTSLTTLSTLAISGNMWTTGSTPSNPSCGNGVTEGSEQCDAGVNNVNGGYCAGGTSCTLCSTSCTTYTGGYCGDSTVNGPEECDGGSGCTSSCTTSGGGSCVQMTFSTSPDSSGSGWYNETVTISNPGSSAQAWRFQLPNGDTFTSTWSRATAISYGGIDGDEMYSTGTMAASASGTISFNVSPGNFVSVSGRTFYNTLQSGCSGDTATCGDGVVSGAEECDNGSSNANNAYCSGGTMCTKCNTNCINYTGGYCGDGIVNGDEECDGGTNCTSNCTTSVTPSGSCVQMQFPSTWDMGSTSWGGWYNVTVTIKNPDSSAHSWRFDLPSGHSITGQWNASTQIKYGSYSGNQMSSSSAMAAGAEGNISFNVSPGAFSAVAGTTLYNALQSNCQ